VAIFFGRHVCKEAVLRAGGLRGRLMYGVIAASGGGGFLHEGGELFGCLRTPC